MDLPVFWHIQSEFLVGALSTRKFLCELSLFPTPLPGFILLKQLQHLAVRRIGMIPPKTRMLSGYWETESPSFRISIKKSSQIFFYAMVTVESVMVTVESVMVTAEVEYSESLEWVVAIVWHVLIHIDTEWAYTIASKIKVISN